MTFLPYKLALITTHPGLVLLIHGRKVYWEGVDRAKVKLDNENLK